MGEGDIAVRRCSFLVCRQLWPTPPNLMFVHINTHTLHPLQVHNHHTMKQKESRISRRKPRKYKAVQGRVNKSTRRQMTLTERAFAVGACIAGGSTHPEAAAYFPHATTSAIQKLCKRVTERSKAENLLITDASLYEDAPGRGRPELLTPRQKRAIVKLVTSDRAHREKEPWQAIADGDFSDIIPVMSITTFENVMYEAGYARRKPGWKPPLTPDEEAERY